MLAYANTSGVMPSHHSRRNAIFSALVIGARAVRIATSSAEGLGAASIHTSNQHEMGQVIAARISGMLVGGAPMFRTIWPKLRERLPAKMNMPVMTASSASGSCTTVS